MKDYTAGDLFEDAASAATQPPAAEGEGKGPSQRAATAAPMAREPRHGERQRVQQDLEALLSGTGLKRPGAVGTGGRGAAGAVKATAGGRRPRKPLGQIHVDDNQPRG